MKTSLPANAGALFLLALTSMSGALSLRAETGCAGTLDASFNANGPLWPPLWPPWAPTPISSVTVQADGKVVIAGGFSEVQGVEANGMARLNANGTIDSNYAPNAGDVMPHTNATQPDGKVLQIETIVDPGNPELEQPYFNYTTVFRYHADQTRDTNFTAALPTNFVARALALQPDGRILVAGGVPDVRAFGEIKTVRQAVVRLNSDGSRDVTFAATLTLGVLPNESLADAKVALYDMVLQADGRIYIGGFFTAVNGVRRTDVARLNPDGSLDQGFEPDLTVIPGADGSDVATVSAVALAPDGKLVIAGFLQQINGVTRRAVARLHTEDGSCSGVITFGQAEQVLPEPGHTMTVSVRRSGGTNDAVSVYYATVGGSAAAGADFVAQQGALDFAPGETVRSFSIPILNDSLREANERFVVTLSDPTSDALLRTPARLTVVIVDDESLGQPGSRDDGFNAILDGGVEAVAVQADGKILIAGNFTAVHGVTRDGLARLNHDGTLDIQFDPRVDGAVGSIQVEPGGQRLLLGGDFTQVNGVDRNYLARLHSDGSLDSQFTPAPDGPVAKLVLMADGRTVVAGLFSSVEGEARRGLARLNADGTWDASFVPASQPSEAYALAVQPDGKVLLAARGSVLPRRFHADGALDSAFQPRGLLPWVWGQDLVLQPDGKILFACYSQTLSGSQAEGLVRFHPDGSRDTNFAVVPWTDRLALQTDGKILLNGLTRLNADGSPDATWFTGSGIEGGTVRVLALEHDGKVLLGGAFDHFNGIAAYGLVRLNNEAQARLEVQAGQPGHVSLMTPIGMGVVIEGSVDLRNWTPLLTVTNGTGRIEFVDPAAAILPQRFYRARETEGALR